MRAAAVPVVVLVACGSSPKPPAPEPKPLPTRVAVEEPEDEEGVTYTSDRGTMDIEVIKAGLAPHPSHHHPDEEIILVKEGRLEVTINGITSRVGPGTVVFIASGDEHGWKNAGDTDATYYVIRLATDATPKVAAK